MPRGGIYGTQRQLLEAMRRHLAEPGPSRFSDETLYSFLDEAAHEVSEDTGCLRTGISIPWPANTERVDIQSDAFDIVQVLDCFWYASGITPPSRYRLQFVSNERFFDFRRAPAGPMTGVPEIATLVESYNAPPANYNLNKYLEIWPIPTEDGVVELYFTQLSHSRAAGTDPDDYVIPIRRAWRDLVVLKALQFAYENLGRPDLKEQKEREYDKMLSGVRLKLLDFTTSSYGEMFDGHHFGYV